MNYLAHGRSFLHDPYLLAGTAVPDWLSVLDRKVRVRSKHAQTWQDADDPCVAAVARGIVQHHWDDDWFHGTRAFAELSMGLSISFRESLPEAEGHRRGFLGHILVELLLDAHLIEQNADELRSYYRALESLEPSLVARVVGQIAGQAIERLALLVPRFVAEGFLWDYLDDDKLCYRLNQVLGRVGLPVLPTDFKRLLPVARDQVRQRAGELLDRPSMPHC